MDEQLSDRSRPVHLPVNENRNRSILYFVTVCTKDRRPLLASDAAHNALREAWQQADNYHVGRYMIMPDHLHLFCRPAQFPPSSLRAWMNYWKSIAARNRFSRNIDKLWQREYWDTQLRCGESYAEKWEYVRNNAMRAGLVTNPGD